MTRFRILLGQDFSSSWKICISQCPRFDEEFPAFPEKPSIDAGIVPDFFGIAAKSMTQPSIYRGYPWVSYMGFPFIQPSSTIITLFARHQRQEHGTLRDSAADGGQFSLWGDYGEYGNPLNDAEKVPFTSIYHCIFWDCMDDHGLLFYLFGLAIQNALKMEIQKLVYMHGVNLSLPSTTIVLFVKHRVESVKMEIKQPIFLMYPLVI